VVFAGGGLRVVGGAWEEVMEGVENMGYKVVALFDDESWRLESASCSARSICRKSSSSISTSKSDEGEDIFKECGSTPSSEAAHGNGDG